MKIGIDLHGVYNKCPGLFRYISRLVINEGDEIHIITGEHTGPKLDAQLGALELEDGMHYTHLYSVADALKARGVPVTYDSEGNPHFPAAEWDREKANYCYKFGISVHIDDSDVYGQYFLTPYARFNSNPLTKV